jgi:hypothetical protein
VSRPQARVTPEERAARAEEAERRLREATAEAHGAIRDLDRMLREYRELAKATNAASAAAAAKAAGEAANAELISFAAEFQKMANDSAADLNASIEAARLAIMAALSVSELEPVEIDGHTGLRVKWAGGLFDDKVPEERVRERHEAREEKRRYRR